MGVCITRPESLSCKLDVSAVPEKRSLTSAQTASHTQDMSPVLSRHREMSHSVSSADSASSLTRV